MSYSGIQVSAWVKIDDQCPIEFEVCGGEVGFSIGTRVNDLQLIATEHGLANLASIATQALAALRERRADA